MRVSQALKIVQALADGIDPNTGEVFPESSPYQHPQTARALYVALRAMERDEDRAEPKCRPERVLPGNAGSAWSQDEDKQLCEGFDAGMTISQLARKHQRTNGSIKSRLEKKGKLDSSA